MSLGYGGGGSTVVVWSPPWEYDLGDRQQRGRAYERVMTEGLDEDVLWFIDVDEVVAMWGELHLSPHIRVPWCALGPASATPAGCLSCATNSGSARIPADSTPTRRRSRG